MHIGTTVRSLDLTERWGQPRAGPQPRTGSGPLRLEGYLCVFMGPLRVSMVHMGAPELSRGRIWLLWDGSVPSSRAPCLRLQFLINCTRIWIYCLTLHFVEFDE